MNQPTPGSIMEIIKKMKEDNEEALNLRNRLVKINQSKREDHSNPVVIFIEDLNNTGVKIMVDGAWKRKKNDDSVAVIGWISKHEKIILSKGGGRIRASFINIAS